MNDALFRPVIFEHLSALLTASTHYSVLLIERAVVGLLRLALILAQKVSLRLSERAAMPTCLQGYFARSTLYIA